MRNIYAEPQFPQPMYGGDMSQTYASLPYGAHPHQAMHLQPPQQQQQPQQVDSNAMALKAAGPSALNKCLALTFGVVFALEVFFSVTLYQCRTKPIEPSQAAELISRHLDGNPIYEADDLPGSRAQDLFTSCDEGLRGMHMGGGNVFGYAMAADAMSLLYRCTKIPDVFERVPEELKGVFWMKGNTEPQELAVLQMGQWFEAERTYLVPFAPFMWAWTEGFPSPTPSRWPLGLNSGYGRAASNESTKHMTGERVTLSVKFNQCDSKPGFFPWSEKRTCNGGSDLRYAEIQEHVRGNLTMRDEETRVRLTLERGSASAKAGAAWRREAFSGPSVMGECKYWSAGSYEMVKVLDGDGSPVEPYYSQFVDYMGDVPLLIWSGVVRAPSPVVQ